MNTTFHEYEKESSYEHNRECAVHGALALVLRASRCAGVAPLSLKAADTGWRVTLSPPLVHFQRIFMTILNLIGLAALILDYREDPKWRIRVGDSNVTAFVWLTDIGLVFGIASLAVYRGPSRMESIIRSLKQLQQINVDLNKESSLKTEKIGVITVSLSLISTILIQATEVYFLMQSFINQGLNLSIMVMYTSYYVVNTLGFLALLQWVFVANAVYGASTRINQQLLRLHYVKLKAEENAVLELYLNPPKIVVDCFTEKHHEVTYPDSEFHAYPSQVQSTIRRLASAHVHIGDVMRQMNEANGTMLIAMLMAIFLHLVVSPYYTYMPALDSDKGLVRALLIVSWSVLHTGNLLLAVEPSHWTHEQRETTKFLLSRLAVRLAPKSKLLARELDQFAKQTVLGTVKLSPLGVLTLGRPLVATIFGGVATYLVILMQFYELTSQ